MADALKHTPGANVIRAFLAGSRFTQTGCGDDVSAAFRAYIHGVTPGDDEEFAADLRALVAIAEKHQGLWARVALTDAGRAAIAKAEGQA